MKNITKENLESFGVQCPRDFATNQKWKDIVKAFNEICDCVYNGDSKKSYYGMNKSGYLGSCSSVKAFNKILSIDEAWEYFYGEEFKKGDKVIWKSSNYIFVQMLPEITGINGIENCILLNNTTGYYVAHTSELTKPNTKRIQEIEQEIKKLSAELKQLKNK